MPAGPPPKMGSLGQTPPIRIACDGERLNSKLNVCSIVFQGHMAAKILIVNFLKIKSLIVLYAFVFLQKKKEPPQKLGQNPPPGG